MTALAPIAPKLARLIPRLGSDHDGEIVATVRAIRRTLAAERLDLHDLANALDVKPEPVFDRDPPPYESAPWRETRWPPWARLREHERVVALDAIADLKLSKWEAEFVASIAETLRGNPYANFTAKQMAVLDRLLARASGGGKW